jgi:hypothetical protein
MYDAISSDGKTAYIIAARGNGKSSLQLEMYRKLLCISDEEWCDMRRKVAERMCYLDPSMDEDSAGAECGRELGRMPDEELGRMPGQVPGQEGTDAE